MLKRRPLAEVDEIITCLSPDEGKFDAVAKGSRRARSPLVGLLEPFTHLQAQFAKGKTLDPLTQARPIKTFPGLRKTLDRITHGSYLLELWSSSLPFREPAARPFALLLQGLTALEHETYDPGLLCRWLELHFLDELGYGPDFSCCAQCQQPVRQGWYSAGEGQISCPECGPSAPGARRVSSKAVSSLIHLRRLALADLRGRKADPVLAEELESLLREHLRQHCSRPLKVMRL